jgi:hypothetical protein
VQKLGFEVTVKTYPASLIMTPACAYTPATAISNHFLHYEALNQRERSFMEKLLGTEVTGR